MTLGIHSHATYRERFVRGGHLFCEGDGTEGDGTRWIASEEGALVVAPGTKVRPWVTSVGDHLWELPVTKYGERTWTAITETERVALVERGWILPEVGEPEPEPESQLADLILDDIAALLLEGLGADECQMMLDTIRAGVRALPEALHDGPLDMRMRGLCEALGKIGRLR
jgi:hypothetical protein